MYNIYRNPLISQILKREINIDYFDADEDLRLIKNIVRLEKQAEKKIKLIMFVLAITIFSAGCFGFNAYNYLSGDSKGILSAILLVLLGVAILANVYSLLLNIEGYKGIIEAHSENRLLFVLSMENKGEIVKDTEL